jgi:hypothetical protein
VRPIPSAFIGTPRYTVHARLLVDGINLTDAMGGFNPVTAAQWSLQADQLAASGSITLQRWDPTRFYHVSPFHNAATRLGDAAPEPGKRFALQTAETVQGATPPESSYEDVFEGYIDAVDVGGSAVVLTCRDRMALLQDRIIEPGDDYYGFTAPEQSMGATIAQIVATLSGAEEALVTLVADGNPDWTVIAHAQQAGISVAEAIHQVCLQRGWAFHYRYVADGGNTAAFVYYDPERDAGLGDEYTVTAGEVLGYPSLRVGPVTEIRNVIELIYGEARERLLVTDAESIALYGRRYMLFSEDANSQIDTVTEAQRMLDGALADLKDADVEAKYTRLYFPWVDLTDRHILDIDAYRNRELDTRVTGYAHSLDFRKDGQHRSTITLRSQSIAARKRWLRTEPRRVLVSTTAPVGIAPQGTIHVQVADRTLP